MGRAFELRKARKMKRWGGMARTFTKLGKDISIAVKSGGPNPETNSRLRVLIQMAKSENMPKDNIERAIKKASEKSSEDYKEITYDGYAPYGIALVIECATDNTTRSVANVRSYFNRYGGTLGTTGSLDFMFERKCRFTIPANGLEVEELELELIDFGAEEVFLEDDTIIIYGLFPEFGSIQKALEEKKIDIINAEFERIPTELKQLTPEQVVEVEKLLEKLEDDDDVQRVFHNMM